MPRYNPTVDYTKVPNGYLRDKDLSLKAKGLLTQILSLSEDWRLSVAVLSGLSSDGQSAIKAALKELEARGYLARRQVRNGTKLGSVEYVLFPLDENPPAENLPVGNQPEVIPPAENRPCIKEIYNKYSSIKELSIKESSIQSISACATKSNGANGLTDGLIDFRALRPIIQEKIGAESLTACYDESLVSDVVDLIVDVLACQVQPVMINGMLVPDYRLKEVFSELDYSTVEEVLRSVSENSYAIQNMRKYLLTCLYTKASTSGAETSFAVMQDFGW